MRKNRLTIILLTGFAAALAVVLPIYQAHAQGVLGDLIGHVSSGVFGFLFYAAVWIMSEVAGAAIIVITYFISIILFISNNIVNSFAVQSGYTVTLAVANLGFVLAIIIIALATILRRETYGIKKTLWKLIVAAILVNFSLIIGGAIINFANTLTSTFLNQLGPNSQGTTEFAKQLAGAFSPQRALLTNQSSASVGGFGTISANVGGDIASVITPLIGLFFAAALLIVIVITLAVFLIMLAIRYVALAFLLILMPFAWLLWLFPQTQKHWHSWWNEFIRWSFFAPIVVFFLWLAIATAQVMNNNGAGSPLGGVPPAANSAILGTIGSSLGSFFKDTAEAILKGLIVVGLAVGGMIVANKLSITGAGAALSGMKAVGNAAGTYVGRRSRQVVTAPLRTEKRRQQFAGMQQRGRGFFTRWTGRIGEGAAVWGGEKAAAGYGTAVDKLTKEQALNQITTSNAMRRQRIFQRAEKEGWTDERLQPYLGKEREAEMKRYGDASYKTYQELRDKTGRSLIDTTLDPTKTRDEIDAEVKKLAAKNAEAFGNFFTDSTSAGYKKMVDELKKKNIAVPITLQPSALDKAQQEIAKSFSSLSSTNASSLLSEIAKKNNLPQFQNAVQKVETTDPAAFAATQASIRANNALYRWIMRGGHRTLIDLRALYKV